MANVGHDPDASRAAGPGLRRASRSGCRGAGSPKIPRAVAASLEKLASVTWLGAERGHHGRGGAGNGCRGGRHGDS